MSSLRVSATWWLPLLVVLGGAGSARANVYTYDNTTSGTITSAGSDGACDGSTNLSRTFVVSETFDVQRVAIGLTIDHDRRGDIRARLEAPDGSGITLFDNSGDTDDDYDILISTTTDSTGAPSTVAIDDADDDDSNVGVGTAASPSEPYFHRLVTLAGMDSFYNDAANGTWTLKLCDRTAGTTGTFLRARLVLTDSATTVPQVCTSTIDYEWGDNGNDQPFTSATFGGVTLAETSTVDSTGDGSARSFTTQTSTFGAQAGYYIIEFDAEAGPPDDIERTNYVAEFSLSPAVHAFAWTMLDIDTGNWEDYVRLTGFDASGNRLPYSVSLGTSHEMAGDIIEADAGNIADTSTAGNATFTWDGAVASIQMEYWAGDELANPGSQRIGIGNPLLCAFDYGDAPNSYGTSLAGGARHVLGDRDVYLGTIAPDGEGDGQPGASGNLDDTNTVGGVDDEDGIGTFPTYVPPSTTYTVSVTASNFSGVDAFIVGYIDWNRDGDFDDPNEISSPVTVPTGSNGASFNVTWTSVPVGAGGTSSTYSRFRISTDLSSVQSPDGQAPDGEVEDHVVPINTLPVTLAWVEAAREPGGLTVRFMTATESRNAGFRVWGLDGRGARTLLGEIPATGVDSFVPQSYEARYAASGAATAAIEIEDLALDNGRARRHGPFAVGSSAGRRPETESIDWQATHAELAVAAQDAAARRAAERATPAALLRVREAGVHRVTYEQLRDAGLDLAGIPGSRLGLTDAGRAVPRFVSTEGAFGPGAFLEFVAKPQLTLASPFDAFVLRIDRRATANPGAIGTGAGTPTIARAEAVLRPQVAYSPGAPNGDPWYDARLLAFGSPVGVARTFDLPDLAGGAVRLTVEGWGYSYFDGAAPDHHVVVRVNGSEVADETFDGLATFRRTLDVTGLVFAAGNTLEFVLPGDTGFTFDLVHFDGFTVEYPRATVAQDGRFRGRRADGRTAAYGVDGFADGPVSVWLDRAGRWTRGEVTAVGGRASVPDGSAEAWLADAGGAFAPEIVAGVPSPLPLTTAQVAIVTHPAFAGTAGLDDLVALQQARGFTVEVATVDRIYAAYGDHAASAEAIRRFVAESRTRGALRYVVLVGADTSDPYDHLGLGSVSFVPTAYLPVVPDVSFSPTDEALVDVDGDGLPDVPVGRLPVRTSAELADAVAKLWAWEQRVAGPPQALFVAGASDAESSLGPINAAYGAALGGSAAFAEVDEIGLAATRSATLAAMDAGVPLVSFVGHSSPGQWDFDPILRWQDVASFTNAGQPNLVTQWGCWNSYYVEPAIESMSGRLLRTPGVGAAGTLGASTLTSDASHRRLGVLFFQQVGQGAPRLGDAFLGAKRALAAEGGALDAVLGMALLGDPAMPLPVASGRR